MNEILYISIVDWYWIKQRPQHFAELLSSESKVFYICIKSWKKGSNFQIPQKEDENVSSKKVTRISNNLYVIRYRMIPKGSKYRIIEKANNIIMKKRLLNILKNNNITHIIFTHPYQLMWLPNKYLNDKILIYDCMDKYVEFENITKKNRLCMLEAELSNIVDYIFVTSNELYKHILLYNDRNKQKISIIKNGVDIDTFSYQNNQTKTKPKIFIGRNKFTIGYIGTIGNWIDFDLLNKAAQEFINIDFYMIGPIQKDANIEKIQKLNNVIFTSSQPYYNIPIILHYLDITIMPFVINELIKSVNPVKIYEYLAMGKPVIAVKYDEINEFGNIVDMYCNQTEFFNFINKYYNIKLTKEEINNKIEYAENNNWMKRINDVKYKIMF